MASPWHLDTHARTAAFFTLMVAVFGSNREPARRARPLVGDCPSLSVFELRKAGLLALGAQWAVELGTTPTQIATRTPGILKLGDQAIPIRSHRTVPAEVFGCPKCDRDCYVLHFINGEWRCRTCPPALGYRCRHLKVRGLARLIWLRKRVGAPQLFAPIAPKRRQARRYWRLAREIRAIEERLVGHLRFDVGDVLEKRYARRYRRRAPRGDL
jgi:hypothetical protein